MASVENCRSLPPDVLFEILIRVPFKKLAQLKCVSRCWRDLITDRVFISKHPDNNPRIMFEKYWHSSSPGRTSSINSMSFDLDVDDEDGVRVQVSPLPTPVLGGAYSHLCFRDSYDGLVLLSRGCETGFILYNPVTGSCEVLPKLEPVKVLWEWNIVHIASSNRYTVIGLDSYAYNEGYPNCVMFDHSSSSWKELALPGGILGVIKAECARKNGKLYWLILRFLDHSNQWTRLLRTSLLCFDPAEQNFGIRHCTPMAVERLGFDGLSEYDGTFYRLYPLPDGNHEFELWVLRDRDARRRPMWLRQHLIRSVPSHWAFKTLAVLQGINKLIMTVGRYPEIGVYDVISETWTYPDVEDEESHEDEDWMGIRRLSFRNMAVKVPSSHIHPSLLW